MIVQRFLQRVESIKNKKFWQVLEVFLDFSERKRSRASCEAALDLFREEKSRKTSVTSVS